MHKELEDFSQVRSVCAFHHMLQGAITESLQSRQGRYAERTALAIARQKVRGCIAEFSISCRMGVRDSREMLAADRFGRAYRRRFHSCRSHSRSCVSTRGPSTWSSRIGDQVI
jgi:hypothetical protein